MLVTRRGFTLIEILTVIAIIAILAGILYPVYLSARAKAKEMQCVSNLKQIGVAIAIYMGDTNGRYPPWVTTTGETWFSVMQKYSRTKLLGKCPMDLSNPKSYPSSYWKNSYCDYWSGLYPSMPPTEAAITFLSSTTYLMDGLPSEGQHTWWGPPRTWWPGADADASERRHNGKSEVLFCDWHVKPVAPNEWKSTNVNTDADNPLGRLPSSIGYIQTHPTAPWGDRNDGIHPWFRGD